MSSFFSFLFSPPFLLPLPTPPTFIVPYSISFLLPGERRGKKNSTRIHVMLLLHQLRQGAVTGSQLEVFKRRGARSGKWSPGDLPPTSVVMSRHQHVKRSWLIWSPSDSAGRRSKEHHLLSWSGSPCTGKPREAGAWRRRKEWGVGGGVGGELYGRHIPLETSPQSRTNCGDIALTVETRGEEEGLEILVWLVICVVIVYANMQNRVLVTFGCGQRMTKKPAWRSPSWTKTNLPSSKCYSPFPESGSSLWKTTTAGTKLARATSLPPVKWAMLRHELVFKFSTECF